MELTRKIGIVGFGNMGSALGVALKDKRWQVYVYDKDRTKLVKLKGIKVCNSCKEVIEKTSILVIAIKPQDILSFIEDTKEYIYKFRPLIISIAAGVRIEVFEKLIEGVRIIRVMPNLAVKKRLSISFISSGKNITNQDLKLAKRIFKCVGDSIAISENFLDKATAISGSGPGYIYYFMDAL
ncbi:MAG: NAD(P)-binding domain-containing protein, partial [Candidatus Omnitrophica bacterium]|nr:NAD(P)-binding domain-containing protein [Candidatus Omnitrophota bacterium]